MVSDEMEEGLGFEGRAFVVGLTELLARAGIDLALGMIASTQE